jgi:hypothetical protein
MHTISIEFRPTMRVNIRNQCSDFESKYRGYFSSGADWNNNSAQEIDTGNMTSIDLKSSLAEFKGALICKLQKEYTKTDNRLESTHILLFVACKSEGYKKLRTVVQLIECDKTVRWDKFTLEEYYQKYTNQFSTYTGPIKDTWLIHDGTVLTTGLELDFMQRGGALNITISEGIRGNYTKRSAWISLKR